MEVQQRQCAASPGPYKISRQLVEQKSVRNPYLAQWIFGFRKVEHSRKPACRASFAGVPQTLRAEANTCPLASKLRLARASHV